MKAGDSEVGMDSRGATWAACIRSRTFHSLEGNASRLAWFYDLDGALNRMLSHVAEMGCVRSGGGNWCGHEGVRYQARLERDLAGVAKLFVEGRAKETSPEIRTELDSLRRHVVDRVEHPRNADLRAFIQSWGDTVKVQKMWGEHAVRYLGDARWIASRQHPLLAGRDLAALEVMRAVHRMLQAFVDEEDRPRDER